MKYCLTCLTPTLIGDGQELAPIDYMVWKDQVNVLDQRRIFKLFARGPRLDGYLSQLKRASKLDFASWGGLAQNYAGRRIPFEHPSLTQHWERTQPEHLFIRTFSANLSGPFVPGTAIKGALRTGSVFGGWNDQAWQAISAAAAGDRVPRRLAAPVEDRLVRKALAGVGASDSGALNGSATRVYLLRTATLTGRDSKLELAWKRSPGGSARAASDGTPSFVEMANPGTVFEGVFRAAHGGRLFQAANKFAAGLLAGHLQYAETAKLPLLVQSIGEMKAKAEQMAESNGKTCLLPLGWGGGFLGKAALIDSNQEAVRQVLGKLPFYQRALQTGLPFPKTRRVVFLNDQPAALAGWTLLEVD